jgi:hypothetical protein
MQFEDVSPPSSIPTPGTIIRIKAGQPLDFNMVCSSRQAFGPTWADSILTSETVSMDTRNRIERTFSIGGDYRKLVGVTAEAAYIDDVKMTLSNAKLSIITSASAREGTPERACLQATDFKAQVQAGEMTMITTALEADVEYVVELKKGVSVSAETKLEILNGVAGKLGGSVIDVGGGKLKGTKLIWGIKRDPVVYAQYKDAHR